MAISTELRLHKTMHVKIAHMTSETKHIIQSSCESPSKKARVDELAKFISDTNDAHE